jgi:predicted lysophospholipase L1 biosynthesis ABC-type transport system permease subunit
MDQKQEQLEALKGIRTLMERSSLFLSLSGLSGIIIGMIAIAGMAFVYMNAGIQSLSSINETLILDLESSQRFYGFLFIVLLIVLVLSLGVGVVFAIKNARKQQLPIWDSTAKRLLINLFIPLVAGGVFCFILFYHGNMSLILPSTLIFYGLALLNASKYTINDIRYLGILEVVVGLLATFFIDQAILLWTLGFGVLHIVYGTTIYFKYER